MLKTIEEKFIKVTGVTINEQGEDSLGKLYSLNVTFQIYSDIGKTNKLLEDCKAFDNLREEELQLATAYMKLATLFTNVTNI